MRSETKKKVLAWGMVLIMVIVVFAAGVSAFI